MTSTKPENISMSVAEIAKNLNDAGMPPEFGEDNSRILIKMWRVLGQGEPVTQEMTANAARESGISHETVDGFLRPMTERDLDDNIIGLMGLSLNQDRAQGKSNIQLMSVADGSELGRLVLSELIGYAE